MQKYESCLKRENATLEELAETKKEVNNQKVKTKTITEEYNSLLDENKMLSANNRDVRERLDKVTVQFKNSKQRKNGVILTLSSILGVVIGFLVLK